MQDNTIYYFFSTYAQCLAALVGLFSTFAVITYQSKNELLALKVQKIASVFRDKYKYLFTDDERNQFRDCLDDAARCKWLKGWVVRFWDNEGSEFKRVRRERVGGNLIEEEVLEFLSWKEEFADLQRVENSIVSFIGNVLKSVKLGIAMIGACLVVIAFTKSLESSGHVCVALLISFFVMGAVYGYFILNALISAFQKPNSL